MLEVVLAPEDKPGGYFGGIYQACAYGQSGFRLVIDQGMNLAVEAFTGKERKYFKGKTALAPGRFYTIGLKFDGARGYIFVDGKLDGSIDMPLPAPFDGPISVGQAGGKDYFFNGLIGDIRLFRN